MLLHKKRTQQKRYKHEAEQLKEKLKKRDEELLTLMEQLKSLHEEIVELKQVNVEQTALFTQGFNTDDQVLRREWVFTSHSN